MNMIQLFTATGITQALHAHHKRLHEKYGFAPLSGRKSIHKFAENFGFDNAEPFLAQMTAMSERMLNASVNLSASKMNVLVHAGIEMDDGVHQFRIAVEGNPAFIIHNVDPSSLAPAIVSYVEHDSATVTIGMFAVRLTLKEEGVHAILAQALDMEHINVRELSVLNPQQFDFLEQAFYCFNDEDDFGWTHEDEEELMDSFMEAMNR